MTPFGNIENQKDADAAVDKAQRFWRESYGDQQAAIGPELIALENEIVGLNFENAKKSFETMAEKLKQSGKRKREANDSGR